MVEETTAASQVLANEEQNCRINFSVSGWRFK